MQPPPPGQQPYWQGPYYAPPVKQGNGFAVAGLILAILAPILGLIFSIIGLVKSGARGGAGKAMSIVGIVLSVIVGIGATVVLYEVGTNVAHSTALDPGCISAENAANQMSRTLNADGAAITRDEKNGNASAVLTDLQKFVTDMQSLQTRLSSAQAQAQHQSVKTQIAALSSDIKTLDASLLGLESGNASDASVVATTVSKLESDGNTLDSTCSSP
jgi:hypothetical protein